MVGFWSFTVAAAATLIAQTWAAPLIVHPGGTSTVIVTAENTVNGTGPGNAPGYHTDATAQLPLTFINNFSGGQVNAYVTGRDSNNKVVMLQPNGQFYYPQANGATTPQPITANVAIPLGGKGSSTSITIPGYISAARIWFAAGNLKFYTVTDGSGGTAIVEPSAVNPQDPSAGINWGFVELTNNSGGIYANISYVDFVGMVLGMTLTTQSGGTQKAPGLVSNAVSSLCNDLKSQSAQDGAEWSQLCVTDSSGNPLRVLAPYDYISVKSGAFGNYWTNYVNNVWNYYSSNTLTINTQSGSGNVACKVSNGVLYCNGDNRGYNKPTAADIFGCNSGPFAIQGGDNSIHYAVVPRLCAAFDRSTLLLNGGNVQPSLSSSNYYTTNPTNYYSKFVHKYEVGGTGYAFAYDDVNPNGENQSGVVSDGNPSRLTITVGGPQ